MADFNIRKKITIRLRGIFATTGSGLCGCTLSLDQGRNTNREEQEE